MRMASLKRFLAGRFPTRRFSVRCARCGDYVNADDVKRAIEGYMPAKLHEKNKRVVDAALEAVGKLAQRE